VTRIDPNTIYTGEEVEAMLHGRASLSTLRRFGLRGLADGYYGQNIHDALVSWLAHRGKVEPEINHEEMVCRVPEGRVVLQDQGRDRTNQVCQLHSAQTRKQPVESVRERFRRRTASLPVQR